MERKFLRDKNALTKTENIVLVVVRLILAAVFIFSGAVKAIDPLGTAYKFQEYFASFGKFFTLFDPLALPLAITLIVLEFTLGINFLLKIYLRLTSVFALLFMLVMTPLTLYIYMYNPVTDCGCFGDALIISNSATFWKNIVLLAFVIYILTRCKYIRQLLMPAFQAVTEMIFVLLGVGFCIYSISYLPLADFRPYKVGTYIPEKMEIPEGAPVDEYNTTFIYEKDGVQQEFTLNNYPKGDSTWVFVDQKSTLIKKGYVPSIHDFSIVSVETGNDITDQVLFDTGKSFLAVMYDLKKTSKEGAKKVENLYQIAQEKKGIKFYALTASSQEEIDSFRSATGVTFPFYTTDPVTLKTIIRSNPGIVLLHNGVVEGKWAWRNIE